MIRLATPADIPRILEITKACASYMISIGIYQWNSHYPTKAAFQNDVAKKELYVTIENNQIVGCVVISTFMDEEYIPIKWLTPNNNNIYIHRLAIHPSCQGQGKAQELMTFAENFAKQEGFTSVRLDTFSKNERNQRFYEQRGYKKLGNIYFPKQSEFAFYCYELVL
ncbi:GNAT family N-acetyltransferase [Winogradskyella sp. A3E31]|uniref:GNAT family N-acetyltransferase n=1 Tax=Winogradskyella sp. A3E31 TaxID=3349637 RepID=UPI00398B4964